MNCLPVGCGEPSSREAWLARREPGTWSPSGSKASRRCPLTDGDRSSKRYHVGVSVHSCTGSRFALSRPRAHRSAARGRPEWIESLRRDEDRRVRQVLPRAGSLDPAGTGHDHVGRLSVWALLAEGPSMVATTSQWVILVSSRRERSPLCLDASFILRPTKRACR